MDGQRRPQNESSLLLRKGQPDPHTVVVVHQEVYADLRRAAVARLPGGTAGALLGNVQAMGAQQWYTVRDAAPLDLEFTESGLTPEPSSLERLRERVEGEHWQELAVIGMFYADPEIGLFPARLDIAEIHRQITPEASLLLLMNPSIDQGAFCLWHEGLMDPVGGFYEALPEESTSIIPWTGDWAAMLIGAAGALKRNAGTVEGRSGRMGTREQESATSQGESQAQVGADHFDMKSSSRPEAEPAPAPAADKVQELPSDEPEDAMALDAIDRMMSLASELEGEGNLTGAVLLYRQAIGFAPIVGDVGLELRLRSKLNRLEEQVSLLEQDITQDATAAWAEARERAEQAEAAEAAKQQAAKEAGGKPRTAVDELFDLGLAAFWEGDLVYARNVLAEVVHQEPGYRTEQHRAANLLAGIERRLAIPPPSSAVVAKEKTSVAEKSAPKRNTWLMAAAIALPVVAVAMVLLFALGSGAARRTQEPRPATVTPSVQLLPLVIDPLAQTEAYVAANGGAQRFGQPLSPLIEEATGGITRTVRYYERGLLSYDAGAAEGASVAVLPLGALELARRYPQGAPTSEAAASDDLFFTDTGFAISGAFREHWEQAGNSLAFGRPVSGAFEEAVEGAAPVRAQYFEYGAMRQPTNDPAAPVEAAPLGAERYRALHESP